MRSILAGFCLFAALASPAFASPQPGSVAKGLVPHPGDARQEAQQRLRAIDDQLHRGEWAAAESAARTLVDNALHQKIPGIFDAVARLALAEAGQGKTDDALRHWSIARNLKIDFDPKPFGAPGELLASHPLRALDEAPPGVAVRRPDGGGAFSPPKLVESKQVQLPAVWAARPRGMRLQVLVDAQGRAGSPVVLQSTSPAIAYLVLEGLPEWRFEPARADGSPVAAFYEIQFPPRRPLAQAVAFQGSPLAQTEALLHAGRYGEAGKQVEKLWAKTIEGRSTIPSRGFLGVALAMRALAAAGQGQVEGAICRWQAAQTLEPLLYGVDLSAYGSAGKLLEDHPWGETFPAPKNLPKAGDPSFHVERPEIISRRQPVYPEYARVDGVQSTVIVESILPATGVPRNLALLTPNAPPGLEASTLDTVCDWRFKPATYQGEPVAVYYSLTVNFEIRK